MNHPDRILVSTIFRKTDPVSDVLSSFSEMGISNVELHLYRLYKGLESPETVKALAKEKEIQIKVLGGGWCDFFPEGQRFENTLVSIAKQAEIARILGCQKIRVFFGILEKEKYSNDVSQVIARNLRRLSDSFHDITFLFENHDGMSLFPDFCAHLFAKVNRPNVKMTFDAINFERAGIDSYKAYELLMPYVKHIHLKGLKNGEYCEYGEGDVDLSGLIKASVRHGYDGDFTLEMEGVSDPMGAIGKSINKLYEALLQ